MAYDTKMFLQKRYNINEAGGSAFDRLVTVSCFVFKYPPNNKEALANARAFFWYKIFERNTMYKFSKRSITNLATCHPILQVLAQEAIKTFDFTVIEGHRNKQKQMEAYASGASGLKWPRSKHNSLPSLAFDVLPYPFPGWSGDASDAAFEAMADALFEAWEKLPQSLTEGYTLSWGGHWSRLVDKPHFQIEQTINKKS